MNGDCCSLLSNGPSTTENNETVTAEDNDDDDDDAMDEEGLLKKGYDVILCGTGLTQSILAAALARAGKSILHCDSNDFYGDLDAVHSLGSLREWCSKVVARRDSSSMENREDEEEEEEEQELFPGSSIALEPSECYSSLTVDSESNIVSNPPMAMLWEKGEKVKTPYGMGTVLGTSAISKEQDQSTESLPVQLDDWILANGKHAVVFIGKNPMQNSWNLVPYDVIVYEEYVVKKQRSFALDIAPRLVFANGEAVDGIVHSGVNEYCEFKSILGLHLFTTTSHSERKMSRGKEKNDEGPILHRVPCSKRDVFQTKLLSPMDKRRLMKFLQIAADYAVSLSLPSKNDDDDDDNDREQHDETMNDADANSKPSAVGEDIVLSLNERQLRQGRSLYRPQNKTVATTDMETLQRCIQEDMSFKSYLKDHHKLSEDMINIIIYAMAMGSSTKKGCEYSTKDGMRDLCKHLQSLGKYGSTAFLTPLYGSGELSQAFCRCAAVHGGTYLLRRGLGCINLEENGAVGGVMLQNNKDEDDGNGKSDKLVRAQHVVVPLQMVPQNGRKIRRVHRRLSIVRGRVVVTNTLEQDASTKEQRHIIIIPPGDQRLGNEYVIHGLVLDDSVNIAPRSTSADVPITVLHLSTFGNSSHDDSSDDSVNVLHNTAQALCGKNCVELYHVSFSYDLYDDQDMDVGDSAPGLHVCRPSRDGTIVVDHSFIEAKRIFEKICPNESFLMLSSEMDELLKERLAGIHDDGDDEVQMLESAMSMVKASDPM